MSKEEAKQYIRNQIDSSIEIKNTPNDGRVDLIYNKQYIRSKKFSTIIGKPVNKDDFKGGEVLFHINTKYEKVWHYSIIDDYLEENYSTVYFKRIKLIEEVFNEYDEYKSYKHKNNV